MNILFIFDRPIIPFLGGVERVTYILATEFGRMGHRVSFLCIGSSKDYEQKEEFEFPQYYIPITLSTFKKDYETFLKNNNIEIAIFQGHYKDVLYVLKMTPDKIKKYSVFHYQPFSLLGKERFVYKITNKHAFERKQRILRFLAIFFPGMFRLLYRHRTAKRFRQVEGSVDKLILLSERFIPRLLENVSGIAKEKLTSINNPLTFTPDDQNENKDREKENLIIFVGRLSNQQKNVTGFIDVWKKFNSYYPDWNAIIIGEGEDTEWIKRYACVKRVENLHFAGAQKDISFYYQRAKILCMTSTYEGWGMVLTESMAYGCVPVVYNSFEAVKDIIDSGKDGILIPPFNEEEMVNSLIKLAQDQRLLQCMGKNGKVKINKFKSNIIAKEWIKLFNQN